MDLISLAWFFLFRDCFVYLRSLNCRGFFFTFVKNFIVMLIESALNLYIVCSRTVRLTIFLWHRTWRNWAKTDLEASSLRINSIIRRHYARCQGRKATNLTACSWTTLTKTVLVVHFYLRDDQQRSNWV